VLESSLQHGGRRGGITSGGQREQSSDETDSHGQDLAVYC
jgi:hypothetical protein